MSMRFTTLLLTALAAAAPAAPAQVIDRLVPAAASPGDLLRIEGALLGGVTSVDFTADVGGFAGQLVVHAVPLSVAPELVTVLVPAVNAFVGPCAVPPSSPLGSVSVGPSLPGGPPPVEPFFFLEEVAWLDTEGVGTTWSAAQGRPVISFDIAKGPPQIPAPSPGFAACDPPLAGNPSFTCRLQNAPPLSLTGLGIGVPAAPPYLMFGDGTLVIDISQFFFDIVVGTTDAQGDLDFPLPVPSGLSSTFALQFGVVDLGANALVVSNALIVAF